MKNLLSTFEIINFIVCSYALIATLVGGILGWEKIRRLWKTRLIRKIWGIRNNDSVVVVCSELDDPLARQNVEPREFVYLFKYGDVDAYLEVVTTLLRLYPNIDLQVLSSTEAEIIQCNLASHLILIGGPDYNQMTRHILERDVTQLSYKTPHVDTLINPSYKDEIALYNVLSQEEFYFKNPDKDWGYFEQIKNPADNSKSIILIGGCHTVGVTGAAKVFSLFSKGRREVSDIVLKNASLTVEVVKNKREYAILFEVDKMGAIINTPNIQKDKIFLKR